jgi:hypothetical protein
MASLPGVLCIGDAGMAAGAGAAQELGHYSFALEGVLPSNGSKLHFESFKILPNGTLIFRAAAPDSGNETALTAQVGVRLQSFDANVSSPATAVRIFNLTVRFHLHSIPATLTASATSTDAAAPTLLTQQPIPTTMPATPRPQSLEISFAIVPQVVAVEGSLLRLPGFVRNIRHGGQSPAFHAEIRPTASGNASASSFALAPAVSPDGELVLSVPQGVFGRFLLLVKWVGENSNISCTSDQSCSVPVPELAEAAAGAALNTAMLVILPLPRVLTVVPALGPARGGTRITVQGTFFSSNSRPPALPPPPSPTPPPFPPFLPSLPYNLIAGVMHPNYLATLLI